jgi:hypothetical protein
LETILVDFDNGETFDTARPDGYTNSADDEVIAEFLEANEGGIGFFGYAYYLEHTATLSAAAIQALDGSFVAPDPVTVADGSYNPLSRRIYMNLLNEAESLMMTAPLIMFGFSDEGSALVEQTGYVVIPDSDKEEMLGRISAGLTDTTDAPVVDNGSPTEAPGGSDVESPTEVPGDSDVENESPTEVPGGSDAENESSTEAPGGSGAMSLFSATSMVVVAAAGLLLTSI